MSGNWCCFAPRVFSPWPFFVGGPVFLVGWSQKPRISRGDSSSARAAQSLLRAHNCRASRHWKCRNVPQVVEHAVTFQHVFCLRLTFWDAQNMELKPKKPAQERWSSNWSPLRGRNPASEEEPTEPCRRCRERPPHAWLGPHPPCGLWRAEDKRESPRRVEKKRNPRGGYFSLSAEVKSPRVSGQRKAPSRHPTVGWGTLGWGDSGLRLRAASGDSEDRWAALSFEDSGGTNGRVGISRKYGLPANEGGGDRGHKTWGVALRGSNLYSPFWTIMENTGCV